MRHDPWLTEISPDDIEAAMQRKAAREALIVEQAAEITRLRAELATARREGMEEAAKRLEELHKNHNYDPESGTLTRKLGRYDRWPEAAKTAKLEHDAGYYRAIAEGVAHIRAAVGEVKFIDAPDVMEGKKDE